mgnify:CR=1 FL=1
MNIIINFLVYSICIFSSLSAFAESAFSLKSQGTSITISTNLNNTYHDAGIKILSSGHSFSSCTTNSEGYCSFTVSNKSSAVIGITSNSRSTLKVLLCLSAAYPTNWFSQSVTVGPVKSNIAYLTNAHGQGLNTVQICDISSSGMTISNCQSTGANFDNPYSIAIHPQNVSAYITNSFDNTLSRCSLNSAGQLIDCSKISSNFNRPLGVKVSSSPYLVYFAAGDDNKIIKCTTQSDGSILGCSSSGSYLDLPTDIALNTSLTRIYVTNYSTSKVTTCNLDPSGDLYGCQYTGSNFSNPTGITINSTGNRVYILNGQSQLVTVCTIANSGLLTGCTTTGSGLMDPKSIVINKSGTQAFITNTTADRISRCIISSTGHFANCSTAASNIENVSGLALVE